MRTDANAPEVTIDTDNTERMLKNGDWIKVAFNNVRVQEVDESTAFPAKVIVEDTGIAGSVYEPEVTVTPDEARYY